MMGAEFKPAVVELAKVMVSKFEHLDPTENWDWHLDTDENWMRLDDGLKTIYCLVIEDLLARDDLLRAALDGG